MTAPAIPPASAVIAHARTADGELPVSKRTALTITIGIASAHTLRRARSCTLVIAIAICANITNNANAKPILARFQIEFGGSTYGS
jgi:hypothetical protein